MDTASEKQKTFACLYQFFKYGSCASPEDTSRLVVRYTNLKPEQEKRFKLRKTLLQKLDSGLVHTRGRLALLDAEISKSQVSSPPCCYYILLQDATGIDLFLLCLIATQPNSGLNLFQDDLYQFSQEIQNIIYSAARSGGGLETRLAEVLPHWYDLCINYIPRAVSLLGPRNLSTLIHACLIGKKLVLQRSRDSGDIARLIRLLQRNENQLTYPEQISQQPPTNNKHNKNKSKDALQQKKQIFDDEDIVYINFNENSMDIGNSGLKENQSPITISSTDTNPYCTMWAEKIRNVYSEPQPQPSTPRSHYQSQSKTLLLHHELMALKEHVNAQLKFLYQRISDARSDYYALYRAYNEIKENPNQDMLLVLLLQEVTSASDTSTSNNTSGGKQGNMNTAELREVLQVIYNFNSKLNMDD